MKPIFSNPELASTLFNTITTIENLTEAYHKVKTQAVLFGEFTYIPFEVSLDKNLHVLQHELRAGTYIKSPMIRINNYEELAMRDRVAQKAVVQVIKDLFEPCFLDSSHGYKQGTDYNTLQKLFVSYLEEGFEYFMDLNELFYLYEHLPYENFTKHLYGYISDERLLKTIRSMSEGLRSEGSVDSEVSELLYNIYMCQLDVYSQDKPFKLARFEDLTIIVLKKENGFTKALGELYIQLLGMNLIPRLDPKAEDFLPRPLEEMILM